MSLIKCANRVSRLPVPNEAFRYEGGSFRIDLEFFKKNIRCHYTDGTVQFGVFDFNRSFEFTKSQFRMNLLKLPRNVRQMKAEDSYYNENDDDQSMKLYGWPNSLFKL